MKNTTYFAGTAVCYAFAYALTAMSASADTACSSTSTFDDHQGINSAISDLVGYCFLTPQSFNIVLYEFGLCTSAATPSNRDQCTTLFSNTAGLELEISKGTSLKLADNISLAEGQYSHAFISMNTTSSIEAVIEFDTPRVADNGSQGVFCYTDGRSFDDGAPASIISCGNTPASVAPAVETLYFVNDDNDYVNTLLNYVVSMRGQSVATDLFMITNTGVLSNSFDNDFALFGSQTLNNPISINPKTSNLDIGFSVTDGISLGFDGSMTAPFDAVFNGLRFIVTSQ